jgi:hypothetical protein
MKKSLKSSCNLFHTKSNDLVKAVLTRKSSKLTPASVCAQKAWQGFPLGIKKELRRTLKDSDKDGVPNGFDCRPRNKRKQESFLPFDSTYVRSLRPSTNIIPDKYLDSGACGDVFTVKGNRNMVVKIPRGFVKNDDLDWTESYRRHQISESIKELSDEYDLYVIYDLENEALFTPTELVQLGRNDLGLSGIGLLRPYVKVLDYPRALSDKQLEMLRQQLISISRKGLVLTDGLQIGIDKSGRPLLFDLGWVAKTKPSNAFASNSTLWRHMVERMTTRRNDPYLPMRDLMIKFGEVSPYDN